MLKTTEHPRLVIHEDASLPPRGRPCSADSRTKSTPRSGDLRFDLGGRRNGSLRRGSVRRQMLDHRKRGRSGSLRWSRTGRGGPCRPQGGRLLRGDGPDRRLPRSAHAIANTDVALLTISKSALDELLFFDKEIARKILWTLTRTLSARLREMNDKMAALLAMGVAW